MAMKSCTFCHSEYTMRIEQDSWDIPYTMVDTGKQQYNGTFPLNLPFMEINTAIFWRISKMAM